MVDVTSAINLSQLINDFLADPKGTAIGWAIAGLVVIFAYKIFLALLHDSPPKAMAMLLAVFLFGAWAIGVVDGGTSQMVVDGRAAIGGG